MKRNIRIIFFITFLNAFIFAYVIERIFGLERGLTILEIQYLIIIYAVICLFLEVPFGVLADKWKRKYVLALGLFFCFFEFFISIFAYSFTIFSFAFLAAGVGGSLKSGIIDSILFQSLRALNRQTDYERIKGLLKFTGYASGALAAILGGYIAHHYALVTTYWLSLIGFPIAIILALTIDEPRGQALIQPNGKAASLKGQLRQQFEWYRHIKQAICVVQSYPSMLSVMIYGGLLGAVLYGQLHEMSSIIYPDLGIPLHSFGYLSFTIILVAGLSGVLAYKLKEKLGLSAVFKLILVTASLCIYLYSKASVWWEVGYLILAIFFLEMVSPLTSGYIQRRIEDRYRVTISSMETFLVNGLTIGIGLVFGYIADNWNIYTAFTALALLLILYGSVKCLIDALSIIRLRHAKKYMYK